MLLGRKIAQPRLMSRWRHEQMAVVVWKAIEDHDARPAAGDDQVLTVAGVGQAAANEAARVRARWQAGWRGPRILSFDIGQAPGGPKLLMLCHGRSLCGENRVVPEV